MNSQIQRSHRAESKREELGSEIRRKEIELEAITSALDRYGNHIERSKREQDLEVEVMRKNQEIEVSDRAGGICGSLRD